MTRRGVTASAAIAAIGSLSDPTKAAVPAALREVTESGRRPGRLGHDGRDGRVRSGRGVGRRRVATFGFCRFKTAAAVLLICGGRVRPGDARRAVAAHRRPSAVTPPDPREAIRREMLQLKGTWTTHEIQQEFIADVPQPPKKVEMIWSIDRDTITQTNSDGFADWTYRYTLDPGKSPKTVDFTSLNTGLSLHGIYTLDGDTLTICFGRDRPGKFATQPPGMQLAFRRTSRIPTRLLPEYPNADGCYWAIRPMSGGPKGGSFPSSMHSGSVSLMIRKAPDGAMLVVLANVARLVDGEADAEYRPVALDGDKKRYLFEVGEGGWSSSAAHRDVLLAQEEFRLDPALLAFDRVKAMGIEVVPAEVGRAGREAASARAVQEAQRAGIEILTRPEVGKPFMFSFKDTGGRVIRSADLKGKVVLIDCWVPWSGPCTEKLPRLKALYDRRRVDGLEVIGLNFDDGPERGGRLIRAMALPWPQVSVPGNPSRRLWNEDSNLPNFPRSLLIDRQGILRWDGGPDELEARIESLLK